MPRWYVPVLVALIGAIGSAWGFARVRNAEADQLQLDLERRARNVVSAVRDGVAHNLRLLETMSAFVSQDGGEGDEAAPPPDDVAYWLGQIEPYRSAMGSFGLWVDATLPQYPGTRALGWVSTVADSGLFAYELFARAVVDGAYRVRERGPDGEVGAARARSDYLPVFAIEPRARYATSVGLDLAADPATREPLLAACASGEPEAAQTDRFFGPRSAPVFLVFRPLRPGLPAGTHDATCADRGAVAFGAFSLPDIIADSFAGLQDQAVEVRVHAAAAALPGLLYESGGQGAAPTAPGQAHWETTIRVAGVPLVFDFAPTVALSALHQTWQPWAVLLAGLLFTGVAVALLLQAESRQAQIERVVAERTGQLVAANRALESETRRKAELEAQLRHTLKMEAVGALAGGIAHDFNNVLTPIIGSCDLLKMESVPGDSVHAYADQIEASAQRAAQLTKQLLGFARKGKLQHTHVGVDATLREVLSFLGRTTHKNISIAHSLRVADVSVLGDPDQIQQVILNLAVNACDAMPDGGELRFTTDVVTLTESEARLDADAEPGSYVRLAVADTGAGIPTSIKDRVFEPFFTTKGDGKGSGMGLAMVYGIVRNHSGFVQLISRDGRGTTFIVYLPVAAEHAEVHALPGASDGLVAGSGRVLVVDDEEPVRQAASAVLRRLGYDVVTVPSGATAVAYCSTQPDDVDVVLLDMVMPEMDGDECFHALRRISPDLRVVLCSGYGHDAAAQRLLDAGAVAFVHKPYRAVELSVALAASHAAAAVSRA